MVKINERKIADIGFFINLDKRVDRLEILTNQLNDFNITGVDRFSAISNLDSGPLNCKSSHYELYKKFLETNYEVLLVLEDDCKFLNILKDDYDNIFNDIYSVEWDLFWLGCRNRRGPIPYKNNTFKVSSVSHAQSYLIKRNLCQHILDNYPLELHNHIAIDELLCLSIYGNEVVSNPNLVDFYNLDSPIETLPIEFISLCYSKALTTQYPSYSDLWSMNVDYEEYIQNSHPTI
jgi:GR25 family glycosyltransferase involved in LPS biosynthesis